MHQEPRGSTGRGITPAYLDEVGIPNLLLGLPNIQGSLLKKSLTVRTELYEPFNTSAKSVKTTGLLSLRL